MKLLGKVWLIKILKFTKNHGLTLSLGDTFFKKPHDGCQVNPPLAVLGLSLHYIKFTLELVVCK